MIVIVNVSVSFPFLFVAVILTLLLPASDLVGVPLTTPVVLFKDSPSGKFVAANVGSGKPVAVMVNDVIGTPAMKLLSDIFAMDGTVSSSSTLNTTVWLSVFVTFEIGLKFDAVITTFETASVVGVPLINPVVSLSVSPSGRFVAENVGVGNPVALNL